MSSSVHFTEANTEMAKKVHCVNENDYRKLTQMFSVDKTEAKI